MVNSGFKKYFCLCFSKPSSNEGGDNGGNSHGSSRVVSRAAPVDRLLWSKDNGRHPYGEYSMAGVQANVVLEDQCQIESGSLNLDANGPQGTFVGIYDGHGGYEAARFLNDRLFKNVKRYTSERGGMSQGVIHSAFLTTDHEFLTEVENEWPDNPKLASSGSCCLAGIVCDGMLYIANAGDSRAVLGKKMDKSVHSVAAFRLTEEHNASIPSVRDELQQLHPDDTNIVFTKNGAWRVRGIIQISRSIGDAYMKKPEFNNPPLMSKFIHAPFTEPILKADPALRVQALTPEDQFIIFASDGLWEHLTDQDAVDIVKSCQRDGIAKELVAAALAEATRKVSIPYSDLISKERGQRRSYHDDITVVVLFLDSTAAVSTSAGPMVLSVKGPRTV